MQRLKQKAENNRDQPATKRQKSSRVVELAVDKEAKEQGPSKQKICPRMPQSEGDKEHPDGGDGAPSTKSLAPKPRELTPAPDPPPTPKQTKRGRSGNIPDEESPVVKVTKMTIRTCRDGLCTRE
ncbi:hypothetical protein RhiTH_010789 [Rhizoctonia solani]